MGGFERGRPLCISPCLPTNNVSGTETKEPRGTLLADLLMLCLEDSMQRSLTNLLAHAGSDKPPIILTKMDITL